LDEGIALGTPKLSVVLPTYNRAGTLARAIGSVLRQSEPDLELIVIDDGSTDGSDRVVNGIGDARIRYFRHSPNRGGNYARNRGIEAAIAPIVSFLDSDDEYLPEKAATVLDFFDRNPTIDAVLDSHVLIYEGGKPPRERRNPSDLDPANFRRGVFRGTLSKPTPSISARRAALVKSGLFDEKLRRRQDMDLLLRLSREHACASISDVLWRKHWVEGAISAERESFVASLLAICDRHPEYLSDGDYRVGLERDVVRHFAELAADGKWRTIARDIGVLRRDGRVKLPALRSWRRGVRIFGRRLIGSR